MHGPPSTLRAERISIGQGLTSAVSSLARWLVEFVSTLRPVQGPQGGNGLGGSASTWTSCAIWSVLCAYQGRS